MMRSAAVTLMQQCGNASVPVVKLAAAPAWPAIHTMLVHGPGVPFYRSSKRQTPLVEALKAWTDHENVHNTPIQTILFLDPSSNAANVENSLSHANFQVRYAEAASLASETLARHPLRAHGSFFLVSDNEQLQAEMESKAREANATLQILSPKFFALRLFQMSGS
jgi:hypothetical protein